jgi:hypothetical protein
MTLCWRFALAAGAAGGSVTAFRGRRATGGLSLVAGRPRLRQRLLGRRPDGATLIAAAKWFRRSCRAENGESSSDLNQPLQKRLFWFLRREPHGFPVFVGLEERAGMEAAQALV